MIWFYDSQVSLCCEQFSKTSLVSLIVFIVNMNTSSGLYFMVEVSYAYICMSQCVTVGITVKVKQCCTV